MVDDEAAVMDEVLDVADVVRSIRYNGLLFVTLRRSGGCTVGGRVFVLVAIPEAICSIVGRDDIPLVLRVWPCPRSSSGVVN